ncbi:hypothetical protein [Raoultibacter phocaeensis]|uniref:hypothetical protein n=1 Tax=Raoultibacter phocaeensis TaxID=2479841 RepID=UPI0015D5FA8C|nr:hypothetical protein [Raoultibacter phocaeensis]
MKMLVCEKCGSTEIIEVNGYRMCCYCRTRYAIQQSDAPPRTSHIALHDDIARLLQKCRENPAQASRYANLVLDIDPSNAEARWYL